jgi:hypothetical protein
MPQGVVGGEGLGPGAGICAHKQTGGLNVTTARGYHKIQEFVSDISVWTYNLYYVSEVCSTRSTW